MASFFLAYNRTLWTYTKTDAHKIPFLFFSYPKLGEDCAPNPVANLEFNMWIKGKAIVEL